jgi:hypothetical protein
MCSVGARRFCASARFESVSAKRRSAAGTSWMLRRCWRWNGPSVAARWTYHIAGAHVLTALSDRHAFMRYEAFVPSPRDELTRVLAGLGKADAGESSASSKEGSRSSPTTRWGIPCASGTLALKLDEQWRRDMPRRDVLAVRLLAWPLLRAYGYVGGHRHRRTVRSRPRIVEDQADFHPAEALEARR